MSELRGTVTLTGKIVPQAKSAYRAETGFVWFRPDGYPSGDYAIKEADVEYLSPSVGDILSSDDPEPTKRLTVLVDEDCDLVWTRLDGASGGKNWVNQHNTQSDWRLITRCDLRVVYVP